MSNSYCRSLQELLATSTIHIDRPRGQPHPRYQDLVYPLEYGFLEGTSSGDGDGIDLWIGSLNNQKLTGILCTFDTVKRDAEIKLLSGCSSLNVQIILGFTDNLMRYLYIPNPEDN